jgi:hypothetical protein
LHLDEILEGGYVLDLEDHFDGGVLDKSHWIPYYLPQWSTAELSAARYDLSDGCLHLLIEADQQPWCPELDGATRVSSLQTGVFAGAVGTSIGQHRFHPDAVVREAQEDARLYTPQFGVFALRAKAVDDPGCMAALWMIGYENKPERSAEICICEIFGRNVDRDGASVGMGVHPFADPHIRDDFEEVRLPIDVREFHEYAAEWTPDHVRFFVDGRLVRTVDQSPLYEMQFMLGIYELDGAIGRDAYPKRFTVDWFRAYRPRNTPQGRGQP